MKNLFRATSIAIGYLVVSVISVSAQDPIHQWSFSETAGAAPDGSMFVDSIGGADGMVRGAGASFTGSALRLPGGSGATQAYGDLPNGLFGAAGASLTDATFEGWYTVTGSQNWQRVFDFGSSNNAEVIGPGGGGTGTDYIFYSANRGGNVNDQRVEVRNDDPTGGPTTGTQNTDFSFNHLNNEHHFAVVVDDDGGGGGQTRVDFYRDGALVQGFDTAADLSNINDVNNWLGRSNWTADANFEGDINEFRIYDEALDAAAVQASFDAGPDISFGAVIPEPSSVAIWVLVGLLGGFGWYRLRKRP